MKVVKESGRKESYNRDKFCNSLREAGAPEGVVTNVCTAVEKEIEPDTTTSDIFRRASHYLMQHNMETAVRYNLKKGIQNLGPAGFHFEHFIETVLKTIGYTTDRNQMVEGECVTHEVDVVAGKEGVEYLIEAKYHNKRGIKSHIDDVMYAEARMEDICRKAGEGKFQVWLITNTKFTKTAVQYAQCRNIHITGWNYPKKHGLEEFIVANMLYPVTVLPAVGVPEREVFAREGLMLAQDLVPYSAQDLITKFEIKEPVASEIIKQVQALVYGK